MISEPVRFYQTGPGMRCKNSITCPSATIVRRKYAVKAVCDELTRLLDTDAAMIARVITNARELDARGGEMPRERLVELDRKIASLGRKISDLTDLAGEGSDEDRAEMRGKVRAAQTERTAKQAERAAVQLALSSQRSVITPEQVRGVLSELTTLLEDGAAGRLGEDAVFRAADVFRQLVGGQIWVRVHARPGRQVPLVTGTFLPRLLNTIEGQLRTAPSTNGVLPNESTVCLRKPSQTELLGRLVRQLIEVDNLSAEEVANVLRKDGHKVNPKAVYQIYYRYYQMIGQRIPKRKYNNGRPRRSRGESAA